MNDLFDRCISVVLRNEGGYSNDRDDKGGETYRGISRNNWPEWEGWKIIDEYKKSHILKTNDYITDPELDKMVNEFYLVKFWTPLNLEGITYENNALQIFDFGVNAGLGRAIRTAQRLSGVRVDGVIGPVTVFAINSMGEDFEHKYKHARSEYYRYLTEKNPNMIIFLNGWLNRVEKTKIYVL